MASKVQSAETMANEIVDFLEENRYPVKYLRLIWKKLFEDFEDFPENPRDAIEFLTDELYNSEAKKLKSILKKISEEE